jgi:hypothetical protein
MWTALRRLWTRRTMNGAVAPVRTGGDHAHAATAPLPSPGPGVGARDVDGDFLRVMRHVPQAVTVVTSGTDEVCVSICVCVCVCVSM